MFRAVAVCALVLLLSACTSLQVVEVDARTGYFPSSTKANAVTSKPVDLDAQKALAVVPNGGFSEGLLTNLGYFDEVITVDELVNRIIAANLTDRVPSITDRIGLNNAAKHYKSFLWLHYESRGTGAQQYRQLVLTDALTMEDYFVSETFLDYIWTGVNDQNNWYPMFNALIDYVKSNSKTYRK
jgi:hypothetical protein